jgi:hypothetical protein
MLLDPTPAGLEASMHVIQYHASRVSNVLPALLPTLHNTAGTGTAGRSGPIVIV